MESDKYYTPEIEEFHVGFDYEIKNALWDKVISTKDIFYDGIEYHLKDNKIRVKYLDQEDIKSLGWIPDKEFNNHYRFGDNWVLHFRKHGDLLYPIDLYCGRKEFPPGAYQSYMFIGIKNKSELKKLMKQLRIDDTIK